MKLLVTGGRDFDDYWKMCEALTPIEDGVEVVIHGAAPGADSLASRWAYENKIDVLAYGAKWGRYGSAAGAKRNARMIRLHPDARVFAFPTEKSRGTWDCVNRAKAAGMIVTIID